MDPASGIIKIVAAFVAGLVIALGGTLIYVKTSAMIHPPTQESAHVAAASPKPEAMAPEDMQPAPPSEEETAPPPPAPIRTQRPKKHKTPVYRVNVPSPEPSQPLVAQNAPVQNIPVAPAAAPAPAPVEQTPQPPTYTPPPDPEPRQPKVITLSAGTVLPVRLDETLSTDHNYTGDTFRGSLDKPIVVDGFIIADKGSKVLGKIVEADKAGRVRGVSNIKLMVTDINTTDGQRVRVQTDSWEKQGTSSMKEDAAKIAGGAALGAIIGAVAGGGKGAAIGAGAGGAAGTGVVLGTRGHETVVPSETRINFRLDSPVTITERLN